MTAVEPASAAAFLAEMWHALDGAPAALGQVDLSGRGGLPSVFAVSDLAAASVGAAGLALADLVAAASGRRPAVRVDRRLASFWFNYSLRPEGWPTPPQWDAVAGDYPTADGWIRLHTNAPHHRAAALAVLGAPAEREAVARAVVAWQAAELESAVIAAGGCAAEMRSEAAWAVHPQGRAVAAEPLLHKERFRAAAHPALPFDPARPLAGIRVLDLTRVLAGPTATRFLAGHGADVLRIDSPQWEEALAHEMTLGKRCALLDLRKAPDRQRFEDLLAETDVLVHGYRSGALPGLGFDSERRRAVNPRLVEVALCAYGWTGPWAGRRGFDSIVQMSSGIADTGMRRYGTDRPKPLPVQALDYAAGFLMAAAALRGLAERLETGAGSAWRTSLARVAALLTGRRPAEAEDPFAPETAADLSADLEQTAWGPARRLKPPVEVAGAPARWDIPAGPTKRDPAVWRAR